MSSTYEERLRQMERRLDEGIQREQDRLLHSTDGDAIQFRKDLGVDERRRGRQAMEDARWRLRSQVDDLMMEHQATDRRLSATFASISQELSSLDHKLRSATRDVLARISPFRGRAPQTVEKTPFYGRCDSTASAGDESDRNITLGDGTIIRSEGNTVIYLT